MGNKQSSGNNSAAGPVFHRLPDDAWTRVCQILAHLETCGALSLEGIYRLSGATGDVARATAWLSLGMANMRVAEATPVTWSCAVKACLSKHEPITTYALYETIVNTEPEQLPQLLSERLDAVSLSRLAVMCTHLARVAAASATNLMTASNLARLWGGILLRRHERPAVDLVEELAQASKQYMTTVWLIQWFSDTPLPPACLGLGPSPSSKALAVTAAMLADGGSPKPPARAPSAAVVSGSAIGSYGAPADVSGGGGGVGSPSFAARPNAFTISPDMSSRLMRADRGMLLQAGLMPAFEGSSPRPLPPALPPRPQLSTRIAEEEGEEEDAELAAYEARISAGSATSAGISSPSRSAAPAAPGSGATAEAQALQAGIAPALLQLYGGAYAGNRNSGSCSADVAAAASVHLRPTSTASTGSST